MNSEIVHAIRARELSPATRELALAQMQQKSVHGPARVLLEWALGRVFKCACRRCLEARYDMRKILRK